MITEQQQQGVDIGPPGAKPVTPPGGGVGYSLEPHVCRACHSRLASAPGADGRSRVYECTNCGLVVAGESPAVLCCCGMRIRRPKPGGGSGQILVDAGIRCQLNPSISHEFPSVYVAMEAGTSDMGNPISAASPDIGIPTSGR